MNDAQKREKVIRGLEVCACDSRLMQCANCPYQTDKSRCVTTLMRDALALLKEQEPRILSWREVKRLDGIESPAVWLEDYDKIHVIPALGLTTGFMDDDKAAFRVRGRTVTANCSDYGKRWRAWTSRPTEEQRKVVAWEPPKEEDSVR